MKHEYSINSASGLKNILFFIGAFAISSVSAQEQYRYTEHGSWYGGFEKISYEEQEVAPGMILIDGIVNHPGEGIDRKVKSIIAPFFVSACEETNGQYLAYLNWIKGCYSKATYQNALPDTTVWLREYLPDTLKEKLMRSYLRDPSFENYPVVGVSPAQVERYAIWKTDRINEMILIREGLLEFVPPTDSSAVFTTKSYLSGKWGGALKVKLPSFDDSLPERDVRMEDGIFLPYYRLLTVEEYSRIDDGFVSSSVKQRRKSNEKQYGKGHHFSYMFIHSGKPGKAQNSLTKMHLFPVCQSKKESYQLNNFGDNVSEWIVDKDGQYMVAGRSWKFHYMNEFPFYWLDEANNIRKAHPDDFGEYPYDGVKPEAAFRLENNTSAAVGFRLAMDYIGSIAPSGK
jgi:hypothetical protein